MHSPGLALLRFVFAVWVLLHHTEPALPQPSWFHDMWFVRYGWTGVNGFFALSGYLFTDLYLEKASVDPDALLTFYKKRFLRIVPLYALLLLIQAWMKSASAYDVLMHLFFLHGFDSNTRLSINGAMWSLSTEVFFYIAIPFVLVMLQRLISGKRGLFLSGLILVALSLAGREFSRMLTEGVYAMTGTYDYGLWSGTVFGRFSDFGIGIFVALWMKQCDWNMRWLAAGFGVTCFYLVSVWMDANGGSKAVHVALFSWVGPFIAFGYALIIPVFHKAKMALATPIIFLGDISYALYLCQGLLIDRFSGIERTYRLLSFMGPWREEMTLISFAVFSTAVAAVLYVYFEKPIAKKWRKT